MPKIKAASATFIFGAPIRIRTRNLSSEDLCDIHFTIGAYMIFLKHLHCTPLLLFWQAFGGFWGKDRTVA